MENIESKYDSQIEKLENQISGLQEELRNLVQLRANELSDFQVGDIVKDKRGKRGKVVRIQPSSWGKPDPIIRFFKKNGQLGERISIGYSWDNWEKV